VRIRVLQESDIEAYQQLRLRGLRTNPEAFGSTYEREAKFTRETIAARIRPTDDKFVLGAFDDSCALVGIVTFVRDEGLKVRHKGSIYGMYVAPESRRQGQGRALITELLARARTLEGLEQVHLSVVSDNDRARQLYRSLGFEIYGVEPHALLADGKYSDEDLMVHRLPR